MGFVKVGLTVLVISSCVLAATIRVPQDQPTIQAGINAAVDGDTVLVAPGVYNENLTYPQFTIVVKSSEGAGQTYLNRAGSSFVNVYAQNTGPNSVFQGFTVGDSAVADYPVFVGYDGGSSVSFHILENRFMGGGDNVITSYESSSIVCVGNLIAGSWSGAAIAALGAGCVVRNNTVVDGDHGIAAYGPNSLVLNNIVVGMQVYAINNPHPTSTVDYNDFWNNGTNGSPGLHGISANPQFMSTEIHDYRLLRSSPCINSGDPDPLYNDPDGSRNDIGAYYYVNTPPTAPEPRLPSDGSVVQLPQPILTVRNPSDAEGDSLLLTFEIANDSSFAFFVPFTAQPGSDSLTTVNVPFYLTEDQHYWWRVKASDYYEESAYSAIWSFWLNSENIAPTPFELLSPPDGLTPALTTTTPTLQWTRSRDFDPFDSVRYELHVALYPNFSFATIIAGITDTTYQIAEPLSWGTNYWWKVKATDLSTGVTWSDQVFSFRVMKIGDPDGNGQISISDAVFLINYIFAGGPAPVPLLSGDADCSGAISISDAVYLINYIFGGGPGPCAP